MTAHIFRVDKFTVPNAAREEFLAKVRQTNELLRTLPGFVNGFVLEQTAGPGRFNFVTIAEWENATFIENAKAAVSSLHQKMNFNPQEMFTRLGIAADLANYRQIEI